MFADEVEQPFVHIGEFKYSVFEIAMIDSSIIF
jgi:hypothetical protein